MKRSAEQSASMSGPQLEVARATSEHRYLEYQRLEVITVVLFNSCEASSAGLAHMIDMSL